MRQTLAILFALYFAGTGTMFLIMEQGLATAQSGTATLIWERTYGGNGSDFSRCIIMTSNGGLLIPGMTSSLGDPRGDGYLLKLDGDGNREWEITCGGNGSEWLYAALEDVGESYVVAGFTNSTGSGMRDIYVSKRGSRGEMIWEIIHGGPEDDVIYDVVSARDGGYILAGFTESWGKGSRDVYLVKVSTVGNVIWERTYGGSEEDWAKRIIENPDGGYVVSGTARSFRGSDSKDAYLLKVDENGNRLWEKAYGGDGWDEGLGIAPCDDGFMVAGMTDSFGEKNSSDVFIFKVDRDGDKLWQKTHGIRGWNQASCIIEDGHGGYALAGVAYHNAYVAGINSNGRLLWEGDYGGEGADWAYDLALISPGVIVAVGRTDSMGAGDNDVYILKFSYTN
jgi:hypothetical protein